MFMSNGGHLTFQTSFGLDPLRNNSEKYHLRLRSFLQVCPSFEVVFSAAANGNEHIFKNNLLLLIDITKKLSCYWYIMVPLCL